MAFQAQRTAGSGGAARRWQRVKEVLDRALDIQSPRRRAAYLDRACGEEPAVRREVESLLAEEACLQYFLARPIFTFHGPVAGGGAPGSAPAPAEPPGPARPTEPSAAAPPAPAEQSRPLRPEEPPSEHAPTEPPAVHAPTPAGQARPLRPEEPPAEYAPTEPPAVGSTSATADSARQRLLDKPETGRGEARESRAEELQPGPRPSRHRRQGPRRTGDG